MSEVPDAPPGFDGVYDDAAVPIVKGTNLFVLSEETGSYHQAQVIDVSNASRRKNNPFKVRYFNATEDSDEWVGLERLWLPELTATPDEQAHQSSSSRRVAKNWDLDSFFPGAWVEALGADGVWYPAEVTAVSKARQFAEAPIRVHYTGWGYGEWVSADRVWSQLAVEDAAAAWLSQVATKGSRKGAPPGGAHFQTQLQALQGTWAEVDKTYKRWHVEGSIAYQEGRDRHFKLFETAAGELTWGSGQYILDPGFTAASKTLVWHQGSAVGRVAFTWRRVPSAKQ